jgi:hypothetical protein
MKRTVRRISSAIVPLTICGILAAGCSAARQKQAQLEHIAKDWCLTIRASQVIPVYPLTEDIHPGDVFLVQVPIGRQQEIYKDKGFLPLDNHLVRLHPSCYTNFYSNSFLHNKSDSATLPYDWIRPGGYATNSWSAAPHAAFPSYSFSIRSGQGMNLAVPIQGVPVGLSLMNSDAADGTVTIKEGHTMGVDMVSLFVQLKEWAGNHRDLLTNYAAVEGGATNYLRVVTRVYATGKMDVSLRDANTKSGGLDVGNAKPVNLLFPKLPADGTNNSEVTAHNYTNGIGVINSGLLASLAKDAAGNVLPGGSVRVTAAGSRTISLQEDFDPPLVLGYLGFDCIILSDGTIDEPIPTYAHLNSNFNVQHAKVRKFNSTQKEQIAAYKAIAALYTEATPDQKAKIRELAFQEKLTTNTDDPEWITKLGILVDGNDTRKLDKFQSLLKQIQTLK